MKTTTTTTTTTKEKKKKKKKKKEEEEEKEKISVRPSILLFAAMTSTYVIEYISCR
jgi:hypothetical protein